MSPQIVKLLDQMVLPVATASAVATDADGAFPSATVASLREAGLLGLVTPAAHGGLGGGVGDAAVVVEHLARVCASSAMVACMHYCGAAVVAAHGTPELNRAIAEGRELATLAFSEAGSRSHFWAPMGTASRHGGAVRLDAHKSWVTSARHATVIVWSSRPLSAEGASTLWWVPGQARGLSVPSAFDGLGLRGNDSSPMRAEGVLVPEGHQLGPDGGGFDIMMGVVLPMFNVLNAATSVGLMEATIQGAAAHVSGTRYAHLGSSLADLPTIRAYLARARIRADMSGALLRDTIEAVSTGRADAMLRVLEIKAAASEAALGVTSTAMRVCGGAAFRKELGVDRAFRDATAAGVMAPTSDVLFDFIGKAICGLPLF